MLNEYGHELRTKQQNEIEIMDVAQKFPCIVYKFKKKLYYFIKILTNTSK